MQVLAFQYLKGLSDTRISLKPSWLRSLSKRPSTIWKWLRSFAYKMIKMNYFVSSVETSLNPFTSSAMAS